MTSKKYFAAMLLLIIFALSIIPASASGTVDVDTLNQAVYANGVPIIVTDEAGKTCLTYSGSTNPADVTGYDIYGGSKDNSYGQGSDITTSITVKSGIVGNVYGGNLGDSSGESSLNTNVVISGGTAGIVYGGSKNGTLNNSILSVSYEGGVVNTIYGGSENGDILNSQLDISVKDSLNTASSKINLIYGGSNNGHILTAGTTKSEINVNVFRSTIAALYGGSTKGNITGDISVSVSDSKITNFHGGSLGGFKDGTSGSGIVGHSHYGNIYGNITSHFYNSSGSVAFGASACGEVFGNVTFHLNACPICDEGEKDASSHICLNSVSGVGHSFNTVVGGGGDSTGATRYPEINYANVYGDTKLVIAGDTSISYRLHGGGRQGNVRKVPDEFGNPTTDGGNVTMIVKGDTYFYWSCAAGYYSHKGLVAEGDVNIVIGGNSKPYQLNGGGEYGGVGGEINIVLKEDTVINTVYGGTANHWWWNNENHPDETSDMKATVIVEGGSVSYLLSNQGGYLKDFNVIINNGTAKNVYGGGGFSWSNTETATIILNGGNVSAVYAGGYDSTTYVTQKSTIYVNENIGRTNGALIPVIYGGAMSNAYVTLSEIFINGAKLNEVYGGGLGRTESSVVNVADNSEILTVMAGGVSGSTLNNTKVNLAGGVVDTVYGGAYNSTVNNSTISISGGKVNSLYLGGSHDSSKPADSSHVINSVLNISGGDVCQKIYGYGETKTDTVGNVVVHLSDLKAKDYWYYLDSDSLANADARIVRHGPLVRYDVIKVDDLDPAKPDYLFPYTLALNETKENNPSKNNPGSTESNTGPSPIDDSSEGFEVPVDYASIIIVLLFPIAFAAFCFRRRNDEE